MEPTDIMLFGIWLIGVFINWAIVLDTNKEWKLCFPADYITIGIISLTSWILPCIWGLEYLYNRIKR